MSTRRHVGVVLATFGLAAASGAAEPDLQRLAAALTGPAVAGAVDLEAPVELGRATITPASGTRIFGLVALDRPCGIWIKGPATLRYRVEDGFSQPVARRNLARASRLDSTTADGALTVTVDLQEAIVWGWDLPAAELQPAAEGAPEFSRWARERLQKTLDSNPARDMLLARFNGQPGYRFGLLRGDGADLVLDVDPRPHVRMEWLGRHEKLRSNTGDFAGRFNTIELAAQPIGRPWWEPPPRPWVMTEGEVDLKTTDGPRVRVRSRVEIESRSEGLRLISLYVPDATMDENGNLRAVSLRRVAVGGEPISSLRLGGTLLVPLAEPLPPGASVAIETETEGAFALRPGKDNYWVMTGSQLIPHPGDNGEIAAAFELRADVESPFVPFASGVTVSRSTEEGRELLASRLDGPMSGLAFIAGKYRTVESERGDHKVNVSSYASAKEKASRRLANNFFAAMECYQNWFGESYPFPEIDVVEINQWGFGVAPPGVIFITRELFSSPAGLRAVENRDAFEGMVAAFASRGANERFAHEVAHGFFPHVVRLEGNEESWLSESFADYVAAICIQQTSPDRRDGERRFERALDEWKSLTASLGPGASIYLAEHLAGEDSKDLLARQALLYGKGPLVLHAIRQELASMNGGKEAGDQAFLTFIRAVVRNFVFKPAGTRHLEGILGQMTKRDWHPFFERYVYGTETPELN